MSGSRLSPLQSWIIGIALVGGALLAIIGIRYLLVPESAAFTFGVADKVLGTSSTTSSACATSGSGCWRSSLPSCANGGR